MRPVTEFTIPPVEPGTDAQDAVNVHLQRTMPVPHPTDTESQASMTGHLYEVGGQPAVAHCRLLPMGSG